MNRKNDKLIIVCIAILVCGLLSWFIAPGMYSSGVFQELEMNRAGLYDVFPVIFSAFDYKLLDVMYILLVGGCYGILTQTKGYRKLVGKTVKFIKGKEIIAFIVVTLLMSLYTAMSSHIFSLFFIVPFIVTVFLKAGYTRITAVNAGFGGMFVGYLGQIYGTYGVTILNQNIGVMSSDWIGPKVVLFIIAYLLFAIFNVLYMKKRKKDETKFDLFATEKLVEKGVKKKYRTKTWPVVVMLVVSTLIIMIGCISWVDSFNISFFTDLHTSFQSAFKISDVSIVSSIVGVQMPALGKWETLLPVGFVFLVFTLILGLMSKLELSDFFKHFGSGMKKISKVAFIYGFVHAMLYMNAEFAWSTTLVNTLFGAESFNIVTLLVGAFLAMILCVEPSYVGYTYSSMLSVAFADNIIAAGVVWRLGTAIALIIGPTSFLLLTALSYADISYKRWFKYIWKYTALFTIAALLFLGVIIYM